MTEEQKAEEQKIVDWLKEAEEEDRRTNVLYNDFHYYPTDLENIFQKDVYERLKDRLLWRMI